MTSKKTIFLTGGTGNMGSATLAELLGRSDRFQVRALVRPEEKAHPVVKRFDGTGGLEWVWGDLTRYEDVLAGVKGADQVLHIGGLVSPMADHVPELTMKVNVGGARNIVEAIKATGQSDSTALVYIGTVAQTGHRNAPVHWGRTGDPIKISRFDQYAVSKTQAEAIVAQSGVAKWVSLRQTGILYPTMWKTHDPIIFHNPFNGVFEWVTVGDSARLAANTCEDAVPAAFWRGFYNIGGGKDMRLVNHEFAKLTSHALGVADAFGSSRPNWSATRNFHGQWYADSDKLQSLVPFRRETMDDFARGVAKSMPAFIKLLARLFPGAGLKRMEKLARGPGGTLNWIENDDRAHIDAYFGSREAWEKLPTDWNDFAFAQPSREVSLLDHGYDSCADIGNLTAVDLSAAAAFRGGRFAGDTAPEPDEATQWRCARGHDFTMSPRLYLQGGHWCPTCQFDQDSYGENAARNPFFAQVWPDND
ncbi:NAD-dependent epimerase/dehydratase family protein [Novosphingobium sp.]|uniref:NAD-dependent epimerase/dehydratase family protein n=1 Tax=Novosphingobium sp. TaxID=1874826 RepID=UPI0038B71749